MAKTGKKTITPAMSNLDKIKAYLKADGSNRHRALMAFDMLAGMIKGYSLQSAKGKALFTLAITSYPDEFDAFNRACDLKGIDLSDATLLPYARGIGKANKKRPNGHTLNWKGKKTPDGDTRDPLHMDFHALTLGDTDKALKAYLTPAK